MFQAVGERSRATEVHEAMRACEVGDVLGYEELSKLAGVDDIRQDRGPIYAAIARLERGDKRTAVVVRNVGYRIAEAEEHEGLVRGRQKRARRQVFRGVRTARAADRSKMSAEAVRRIDALGARLARHEQMLRASDERIAALERGQHQAREVDDETAARVARLEELLRERGMMS